MLDAVADGGNDDAENYQRVFDAQHMYTKYRITTSVYD